MVRTLVVGSTGDIGLPLTLALVKEGHAVFALVRSSSRNTKAAVLSRLEHAGVQLVEGDLGNAESVQEVFRQLHPVEAVVCAVAGYLYALQTVCESCTDLAGCSGRPTAFVCSADCFDALQVNSLSISSTSSQPVCSLVLSRDSCLLSSAMTSALLCLRRQSFLNPNAKFRSSCKTPNSHTQLCQAMALWSIGILVCLPVKY